MDNTVGAMLERHQEQTSLAIKGDNIGETTAVVKSDIATSIAEIKAQVVLARSFPRDEIMAIRKIEATCKRQGFARKAMYAYPRGKDDGGKANIVNGPSIRLAEAIARAYGNLKFGIRVMERDMSEHWSDIYVYAWDMENNTPSDMRFRLSHKRDTKKGSYIIKDERDISELELNYASRRLRRCILNLIPHDILETALDTVAETLAGDGSAPLVDRIRNSVIEFSKLGVSQQMLEEYFAVKRLQDLTVKEFVEMMGVYSALSDGTKTVKDYFSKDDPKNSDGATDELVNATGGVRA